MHGSPRPSDDSLSADAKRGIRWDALAAIVAALVGLLACTAGSTPPAR